MRGKIASVYFMDTSISLSVRTVDETELLALLQDPINAAIVAVQVCMGGWPLKGSGVFEHRISMKTSPTTGEQSLTYETHELMAGLKWSSMVEVIALLLSQSANQQGYQEPHYWPTLILH